MQLVDGKGQTSRRSERGGHVKGRTVWELKLGGHCEPDAVTRRTGSGRAVHESRWVGDLRSEARSGQEPPRRRSPFRGEGEKASVGAPDDAANRDRKSVQTEAKG